MINNIVQDEYDILIETQSKAIYLLDSVKKILQKKRLDIIDKEYINSQIYLEINNILNKAFNNHKFYNYLDSENLKNNKLPDNYIKPDKNYMDLLKIAYSMNDQQFKTLITKAKEIKEKKWLILAYLILKKNI